MNRTTLTAALLCVSLFTGCATRGAGYVPVVDMLNKDADTFATDLTQCQGYAKQRADAATAAMAGAILGALIGAAAAPRAYRGYVAGYGAAAVGGSAAVSANDTQETIIKRCLSGRGYNVLALRTVDVLAS